MVSDAVMLPESMGEARLLLGPAWAMAVLVLAFRWRPAPTRVRALDGGPEIQASSGIASPWGEIDAEHHPRPAQSALEAGLSSISASGLGLWTRAGTAILRACGKPPNPLLASRLGGAAMAVILIGPLSPVGGLAAALVGWAYPGIGAGRRQHRLSASMAADIPEIVDLLALSVGAGLTVSMAVDAVGRRGRGALAGELRRASREAGRGHRLADALDDVVGRAGEGVRPLISALVASERYGAPLGVALERLSFEARENRRRQAEEAARKIPIKLLFPLVSCTLPAFVLLTVAPLVVSAVRSLRL